MKTDTPPTIHLKDYKPSAFLIPKIDLEIALEPTRTRVKSRMKVAQNTKTDAAAAALRLDGEGLELISLTLDGRPLPASEYVVSSNGLTIPHPPKTPFTLEIETCIDPKANTALQGIYLSRGVFCSQCEAEGFRRITYFLDRPDILSVYSVRLEADFASVPVLLANGNPVERGTLKGNRHYALWRDPFPKPCYLFAIVGGDLSSIASTFTTVSGREVDLRIYVEHGKEERAHWAMDALKRAMAWDEKRFGREYDLDVFNIVAVSDFNMGAMENKGLNIFNDRLILASADTATDSTYEAIESVVAHEYFHNWTGNRITCRDWFQLCLKEGLTVYRDQEFSSDERSATVQRITDVRQLRALQFPEDQGPLAHSVRPESYVEINNFYTPTVYEKGAELVRMIETILGRHGFRAGMDLYFSRHDGDAATIEDFIICFEEATGRNLAHFKRWYSQAGTPELVCRFQYDRDRKTAELEVTQVLTATPAQPKKEPLFIPLRFGLIGDNGKDLDFEIDNAELISPGVLAVTKPHQSFHFSKVSSQPVPSLLRGFSAPVNVRIDLSDRDLAFLMTHDSDLFNRWQAANQYATRAVLSMIAPGAGRGEASGAAFAEAIRHILADHQIEEAYKAELLKLPTQSDIAREKARGVDPAAIDVAHRKFSHDVAIVLADTLVETYDRCRSTSAFSPDAQSAGKRALRNAALTLLAARGEPEDLKRLEKHYFSANNMTEAAHALFLVAARDIPPREAILQHFYERWQNDHLVIDQWFAAQAQSPLPSTLDRVDALTAHPLFRMATPNKVRALIGTFAMANPLQFNRPDGAGYEFVASKVLEIDKLNPQVAARILGAFRSIRSLEPERAQKATEALKRVAETDSISRDVGEIVGRILDA